MLHIESCEHRRLMTNTGLDTAFGSAGSTALVDGDLVKSILPTPGGIYVDVSTTAGRRYVRKFTAAGRLDATWGDGGSLRVLLAAQTDGVNPAAARQIAYDSATGNLYVAGSRDGNGAGLAIERLTAAGQLDTAFGTRGVVYEEAKDDGKEFSSDYRRFNGMAALPGGRLLVSFQSVYYSDFYGPVTHTNDLSLWRLTGAGVADATFGTKGQVTVARGGGKIYFGEHDTSTRTNVTGFADMQPAPDGSVRLVTLLTNQITDSEFGFGHDTETLSQSQYVQTRTVSASGSVDAPTTVALARDAYENATEKKQSSFRVVQAKADGRYTRVVGVRGPATGFAAGGLTVLTVGPKGRSNPAAFRVADGGVFSSIATSGTRTAVFSGTRLSVLNNDATPARFGTRGSVAVDSGLTAAAVDDTGRVLAAEGATLLRFDGD